MALAAFMVQPVFSRKNPSIYPFIFNILDKWTAKDCSMDEIDKLMKAFGSRNRAEYGPGDELPGGFVESVATDPAAVEWQNHPQVLAYKRRGRLVGWDRRGHRIWTGEG